jgi:formamidopyrimidine-DNA glycosylase
MPELPEVEAAIRQLRPIVEARTIVRVRTLHAATVRALPDDARRQVEGRRITAVERRGKHQLLRLDDGAVLHAHFRMAGDWHVAPSTVAAPPHARLAVDLDDGVTVWLVDPRALATLVRLSHGAPLPAVGPDALTDVQPSTFATALARRRGPIKPALLDQRVLAGVGNIYAAEALWRARIDPRTVSSSLGARRRQRLLEAVRDTLADALVAPGRYARGETVAAMRVYGREGEPCARCATPVRRIVQAGRSTYFCARCQR